MQTNLTHVMIKGLLSTDALRPAMQQALYDAEKGRLIMTNGHLLACFEVERDKGDKTCLLPIDAFNVKGIVGKGETYSILTDHVGDAQRPGMVYTHGSTGSKQCNVYHWYVKDFPSVDGVIDRALDAIRHGKGVQELGINLQYVAAIVKSTPLQDNGLPHYRMLLGSKDGDAVIIKPIDSGVKVFYLIMPVRLP